MHLAAPFQIGGVHEGLAEAGRAPVVDTEHRVTAIGEPLVRGMEPPDVARPRPAVHQQHHRPGLALHGCTRTREVTNEVKSVAGARDHRLHPHQRCLVELRPCREQQARALLRPVIMKELRGCRIARVSDQPVALIVREIGGLDVAGQDFRQIGVVGGVGAIGDLPAPAQVHRRRRDRPRAHRRERHVGNIGFGVLGQHARYAGCQVLRNQGRLIATARVEPIEFIAVVAEFVRPRGHGVGGVDMSERLPLAAGAALEIVIAAVVIEALREADAKLRVGEETAEAIIVLDARTGASGGIDAVDFKKALVALVVRDQKLIGETR